LDTTVRAFNQGLRTGGPVLRLAVHQPAPQKRSTVSLMRKLGNAVLARKVQRPQEVRTSDDLVVVPAGATTFVRSMTDALGPLAPPVLVVARRTDDVRLPSGPQGRAAGYLVMDGPELDGLVESLMALAVLATARRQSVLPQPATPMCPEPLTPRERDIMTLLASGFSIREIADDLALGGKTVRNYLSNIYRKLGVHRQAEALIRWLSIMEAGT